MSMYRFPSLSHMCTPWVLVITRGSRADCTLQEWTTYSLSYLLTSLWLMFSPSLECSPSSHSESSLSRSPQDGLRKHPYLVIFFFLTYNSLYYIYSTDPKASSYHLSSSSESRYKEPRWNGAKYVMSPPLRTRESNFALWEGLRGGDLRVVADHTSRETIVHANP